jgi:DNA polymerase-3 subunit chi
MTRVDFYVLNNSDSLAREKFACRLVEKALQQDNQIYLHVQGKQQCQQLDQLLWNWRQNSFVPHQQQGQPDDADCPVLIGYNHEPEGTSQVLINLDFDVPGFFSRFDRVIEIVDQNTKIKEKAREHFTFYRDRGYDLNTHNIN